MTAMADKWEFYKDAANEWRWRRTAPNGEIVGAATEGYKNKSDCEENALRHGWPKEDTWDFYKDNAGEWRWRRTAINGEIVGASTEGYHNKSDCEDNAKRLCWPG